MWKKWDNHWQQKTTHVRVKSMRCLWKKIRHKVYTVGESALCFMICYMLLFEFQGRSWYKLCDWKNDGQKCAFHQLHYIDLIHPGKVGTFIHLGFRGFGVFPVDVWRRLVWGRICLPTQTTEWRICQTNWKKKIYSLDNLFQTFRSEGFGY